MPIFANPIVYEELATTFKYENETLYRFIAEDVNSEVWKKYAGQWIEVNTSKPCKSYGYLGTYFKGHSFRVHRIIYSLYHQVDIPVNLVIDHRDGNRYNNHPSNLRLVTQRENLQNRRDHREGKLCGVSYCKANHSWVAKIQIGNDRIIIGYFSSDTQAYTAYIDASTKVKNGEDVPKTLHVDSIKRERGAKNSLDRRFEPIFVCPHPEERVKPVSYCETNSKWQAQTVRMTKGKRTHLGFYDTQELAEEAYQKYLDSL
jgi:signal recognition particle subunit SEC65